MPGVRRGVFAAVTGAAALVVIVALAASGAHSAGPFGPPDGVACTFDPKSGTVRIEYGTPGEGSDQAPIVWISRSGDAIRIEEEFPGPGPNVVCAGGSPTVRNTDRIDLAAVTKLRTSETFITIGDRGLAPGATPEPGGDEIETESDLGSSAQIHVNGGRGPDRWRYGSRSGHLVNFNVGEARPDADLSISTTPRDLSANLSVGSNRVTARGGAGTGSPLQTGLELIGDSGNDRFIGGPRDDELLGYEGNDVLNGRAGDDRLDIVGGKGRDLLICGPGRDRYRSSAKDEVHC